MGAGPPALEAALVVAAFVRVVGLSNAACSKMYDLTSEYVDNVKRSPRAMRSHSTGNNFKTLDFICSSLSLNCG